MTRRVKVVLSAAAIPLAAVAGLWLRWSRPWETPTQRAYRVCGECEWTDREVDWLIDANKHSTLTRKQSLALFRDQFADQADATFCDPCAASVLDAAASPFGEE